MAAAPCIHRYFSGSAAGLIGAVIAAMIFKKYFVTSTQKLCYLMIITILTGMTSILPIFCHSFTLLILVVALRAFLGQMLEIPCQGLYVYTLGTYN